MQSRLTRRDHSAANRVRIAHLFAFAARLAVVALLTLAVTTASAHEGEKPLGAVDARDNTRLSATIKDDSNERITGKVRWFSVEQVAYTDADDQPQVIEWAYLDPQRLGSAVSRLPDLKDAEALMVAAEVIATYTDDTRALERLLGYALRVNKELSGQADALRELIKAEKGKPAADEPSTQTPAAEAKPKPNGKNGKGQFGVWAELTEAQHKEATAGLIKEHNQWLAKANLTLKQSETDRFLFYSDLSDREVKHWSAFMEKTYDQLCEVFGHKQGTNVWRGKCVVLLFKNRNDYIRYCKSTYDMDKSESDGFCKYQWNGDVHILGFKKNDKEVMSHILVHEATHGFGFRYETRAYGTSWINEGLAEYVATKLVNSELSKIHFKSAKSELRKTKRLGDFLKADSIKGNQYGLAYDITRVLIEQNREGYIKMLKATKHAKSVEDAFKEDYGVELEKIIQFYAKSELGLDHLGMD